MALAYSTDIRGQANGVGAAITSNTLSVVAGDFLTIVAGFAENVDTTAWTVSNNNTAIVWTKQAETTSGSNCKVILWSGTAGATPPTTVTVTVTAGPNTLGCRGLFVAVHHGQHATSPLPAGNIFSGTGGTDVSQAITPTSAGSALWMVAADWQATNSYAAIANCSLTTVYHEPTQETMVGIRPTAQPLTGAVAFTIGETDTAGKIAWVAWEVRAAPSTFMQNRGLRPAPFRPGLARLMKAQKDRHNGPAYRTVLDRAA